MSVTLYFGLPGCGKTTVLTMLAYKHCRNMLRIPNYQYKHIYGNVHLKIDGYTYIDSECIGKYELEHCLILIDEATLFADSRDWKNFSGDRLEYFLEHRHHHADIVLFTQQWDGVDRKIRVITDRVYYLYKGFLTGFFLTRGYRVPYGILIPSKKDNGSDNFGEILQGYYKPSFLSRLFGIWAFRPTYYKYFDSFYHREFPPLPPKYKPYRSKKSHKPVE